MQSKKSTRSQLNFLAPGLVEQLNPNEELYLLSNEIDWSYFEEELSGFYSREGRPAHPIRLMVSLLILKSMYNLSDETLVEKQWVMNPWPGALIINISVGMINFNGDSPVRPAI